MPPASLSVNLLASCFITLLWWISSSIENLCELSTIIMPITMRVFFFLCCFSCTNGKIASSCQLCDGYCYNGGTCQLDPETNVPVCLWVFYNAVGILWYDFRCAWNLCSIVLRSWGNILNECFMNIFDQVLFLIGLCTTELSPSLICYWFHKEEIIHSLASYLFQRFRDLWTWKCL